jgi:hypothetical protein
MPWCECSQAGHEGNRRRAQQLLSSIHLRKRPFAWDDAMARHPRSGYERDVGLSIAARSRAPSRTRPATGEVTWCSARLRAVLRSRA